MKKGRFPLKLGVYCLNIELSRLQLPLAYPVRLG